MWWLSKKMLGLWQKISPQKQTHSKDCGSYAFRHSLRILRLFFFSILLIYKLNCTLVNWWWWIIAVTCNCLSYPDSFSALTGLRNIVMIVLVQLVHKQNSEDERQVVRKGLLTTQVASCIFPNFGRMNGLKTNRFKPNCNMRCWKKVVLPRLSP